jgi:iron complex transport system ATP-binding protein
LELQLQKVSVTLGKRNILQDVSLSLSEGLTFVAGLNGSGKSTLLRAIAGLASHTGQISLDRKDLSTLSPKERARHIALLHQRLSIGFAETALHFVRMGRYPHLGWLETYQPEDTRRAEAALEQVGASQLAARLTDSLSGGELQKVLLARALCQDAQVLLLDEPATFLDPKNAAALNQLLRQLATAGRMVVCVTHDVAAFAHPGARVLGIREGKNVLDRPSGPELMEELNRVVY